MVYSISYSMEGIPLFVMLRAEKISDLAKYGKSDEVD
jgi:hypothetical protein